MATSLHQEIHGITDKHEHARNFLFQRGILKSSMSWPRCSAPMTLTACSTSRSPDLLIWRCSPCRKFKNIRTDSVLSGQKLSLQKFLMLIFYLSIKSLTSIAVAQLTDLTENTISEWKILLHVQVSNWLMANPSLLGGPGVKLSSWTQPNLAKENSTKDPTAKDSGYLELWTATLGTVSSYLALITDEMLLHCCHSYPAGFFLDQWFTRMNGLPTMDGDRFDQLNDPHIKPSKLLASCKAALNDDRLKAIVKEMRSSGGLLK